MDFEARFELFQIQVKNKFAQIDREFKRVDLALKRVDLALFRTRRSVKRLEMTMEGGFTMIALHIGKQNRDISGVKKRLDTLEGGSEAV